MSPLPLILMFAVAALYALSRKAIAADRAFSRSVGPNPWEPPIRRGSYAAEPRLFTPAEQQFFQVLAAVDLPRLRVFGKVRLADIFGVKVGRERPEWWRLFSRVSQKHVDFVLVREADSRVVLGIELDDRSHDESSRHGRDSFVNAVFYDAGIPLLRVPARGSYSAPELRRQICRLIPSTFGNPPAD